MLTHHERNLSGGLWLFTDDDDTEDEDSQGCCQDTKNPGRHGNNGVLVMCGQCADDANNHNYRKERQKSNNMSDKDVDRINSDPQVRATWGRCVNFLFESFRPFIHQGLGGALGEQKEHENLCVRV